MSVAMALLLQAVACSLYTVGFGESIAGLIQQDNPWVAKGIALGVTILLVSKLLCLLCVLQ